jgi:putative colanic acid biosysnthesis UDP-glucose lipid carrier transferase
LRTQDHSIPQLKAVFPSFEGFGLATAPEQISGKRVLDVTLAFTLLLLALPLLALITLAIMADSRGPVLFAQRRAGLAGKSFAIFKFRSMHVLEDGADIVQAAPDDVRITRIGRFLRALSLDELPQLINVLLGDMSLVGPRPHAAAHDDYYAARIANYRQRHLVKPGITGWAQINGARGATPELNDMQMRVDHDLFYVEHGSLGLDLKILVRTPWAVLSRRNAF